MSETTAPPSYYAYYSKQLNPDFEVDKIILDNFKKLEEEGYDPFTLSVGLSKLDPRDQYTISNFQYGANHPFNEPAYATPEKRLLLPSRGLFNKNFSGEVTLRALTTADEKILAGCRLKPAGKRNLELILQRCTDISIPINELLSFDKIYLLAYLRAITYGSKYEFFLDCPSCGFKNRKTVHVPAQIEHRIVRDHVREPFTIYLKESGINLSFRHHRHADDKIIHRYAAEHSGLTHVEGVNLVPDDVLCRYAVVITEIDNLSVSDWTVEDKIQFLEKLPMIDFDYYKESYDIVSFGLNFDCVSGCDNCRYIIEFTLPMSEEFFIPEDKEYYTQINEQQFGLIYYGGGGFSYESIQNMPVYERLWFYKKLAETKEKEYKEREKANQQAEAKARAAASRARRR